MEKSLKSLKGFTLIELMTVIAIIGILASVIVVNMNSSVTKSKRVSALTSASSALPELVTCQDDGGFVKTTPVENEVICWGQAGFTSAANGHNAVWPRVNSKTGWTYAAGSGTLSAGTYTFTLTKSSETTITCSMSLNGCE